MTDWRQWTPERLERELNPRVSVADAPAQLERLARRSAATRAALGPPRELAYGDHPRERIDFYPAATRPAPLHVYFHGGYWRGQERRDYAFIAEGLVRRGVHVALAGYPLCPEVGVARINAAAARCLAWICREAPGLGVDPARITVSGHSAGGQIAVRLLESTLPLAGILAVSGVFDLEPVAQTSINAELQLDAAGARAVSPLHLPPPGPDVPLLLAVGGAESEGFREQTRRYARHCATAGHEVPVLEPAGRHHFDVLEAIYDESAEGFPGLLALARGSPTGWPGGQ